MSLGQINSSYVEMAGSAERFVFYEATGQTTASGDGARH